MTESKPGAEKGKKFGGSADHGRSGLRITKRQAGGRGGKFARFVTLCLCHFVTLVVAGCATTRMPEGSRPAGLSTITAGLPQRIAILPIVNGTDRKEAPDVVRAALHQQLNATTYTVQKLFVTDELLARGGLQDAEAAVKATPT